ncbi:MAG: NAD(P)-dependent oxidoreductase [Nanoarchaeota archaeon]
MVKKLIKKVLSAKEKLKNLNEQIDQIKKQVNKLNKKRKKVKIVFFELEGWEEEKIKEELKDYNVELIFNKEIAKPTDAEIISFFIYSKIDKEFIDKSPNLKLIVTRSAGVDHIDINYAKEKGIEVKNCPSYGPSSVAEFSFLLLLAVARKLRKVLEEEENFSIKDYDLRGIELRGKTIGIIGTGKIGSVAAKIALGFGMKVLAYDKFPKEELKKLGVEYKNFEEILKEADILSFYVPFINKPFPEGTYHMINKNNLNLLKDGVIIINVSRGPVLDLEAIEEGLKTGKISAIGLDVMEGEKTLRVCENKGISALKDADKEEILRALEILELMHKYKDRVLLTPHIAYNTWESINNIWETTFEHIKDYLKKNT